MAAVIALGCSLAIAGGAMASTSRTTGPSSGPPQLKAKQGGSVVAASLGSYSWTYPSGTQEVGDSSYPLPIHGRLTGAPGGRVSLRIGASAARVTVSLLHAADFSDGPSPADVVKRLPSNSVSSSRSRWATQLPADLKNGNVLDINVRYANDRGEADFWVGLR